MIDLVDGSSVWSSLVGGAEIVTTVGQAAVPVAWSWVVYPQWLLCSLYWWALSGLWVPLLVVLYPLLSLVVLCTGVGFVSPTLPTVGGVVRGGSDGEESAGQAGRAVTVSRV